MPETLAFRVWTPAAKRDNTYVVVVQFFLAAVMFSAGLGKKPLIVAILWIAAAVLAVLGIASIAKSRDQDARIELTDTGIRQISGRTNPIEIPYSDVTRLTYAVDGETGERHAHTIWVRDRSIGLDTTIDQFEILTKTLEQRTGKTFLDIQGRTV